MSKKIVTFAFLISVTAVLFSFSLIVVPEKKDSGNYLYCFIDSDGPAIVSSNVFVTGEDVFFTLQTFVEGSKVISGAFIPSKEIIDFFHYDVNVYIKTSDGNRVFKQELIGINGFLLPLHPTEMPYRQVQIANHHVLPGEYLYKLAEQYDVDRADLEILNKDKVNDLHAGDELVIGTVQFENGPYEIRVSLERCSLTLFYEGIEILSFPVAVGRGDSTPPGIYYIKRMVGDPALYWEGEYIQPLSPINGLGKWWLELSNPQYGIHGTNKSWEIGKRISHGCIRMFNEDVVLLQSLIPVGTRVIIK